LFDSYLIIIFSYLLYEDKGKKTAKTRQKEPIITIIAYGFSMW